MGRGVRYTLHVYIYILYVQRGVLGTAERVMAIATEGGRGPETTDEGEIVARSADGDDAARSRYLRN